ncbi:MAG: transposase, partial [Chloroflexota bacterium]
LLHKSIIANDEWGSCTALGEIGYKYKRFHHWQKLYASGCVHTNTIDGFWSLLRRGIGGEYQGVWAKHLPAYLDEYTYRDNHRHARQHGIPAAFLDWFEKGPTSQHQDGPSGVERS